MCRTVVPLSIAILLGIPFTGCGGNSMSVMPPASPSSATAQVSFSISDAPPMNVTILRFAMQVVDASLQPMMSGQQAVSMLSKPTEVELEHLQTEPAFLSNLSVMAGTYNGISVTFANPQMTILNQTGKTLTVGMQNCADGQVCTLTPVLNSMTVMVQAPTSPFPITLSSNSPLALLLHFDINASIQGDLSVSPAVSLAEVPPLPTGEFERFHVVGAVTAVNSPNFTLQTSFGGQSFTLVTDDKTKYRFDDSCNADNFSCIAVGQLLRVKVRLMPDGTLDASSVELLQQKGFPEFQGVVTATMAAQNQFQLVLTDMEDDDHQFNGMTFGLSLTIQPTSSATFSIDSDGLTLPSSLSFATIQDVSLGQVVRFHPVPPVVSNVNSGMIQIMISADSIALEPSEITGTVSAVNPSGNPPSFTLSGLSPLFTNAKITQLTVEPVMGTDFDNVSGLGGLNTNDSVSVGGLLFNTSSGPLLIAERVVKRQPEN